jgi:hypothetical protein
MFFMGVGFAEASLRFRRAGTIALIAVLLPLVVMNCLVTNQFHSEFIEYGPVGVWTDAILPLADYMREYTSMDIYTVDWGMNNSLRLLDRGTLRLQEATFAILKDSPDELDRGYLLRMIRNNDAVIVAHTASFEVFPGINARLNGLAKGLGYRQEPIATIYDHEGRPVFQVFHYKCTLE